jgi:hypothetical protein
VSVEKSDGEVVSMETQEVDVKMTMLTFAMFDHNPVEDEQMLLSREEFARACATALFEFDIAFKDVDPQTNPFQNSKHTYSVWMNAFIGYASW